MRVLHTADWHLGQRFCQEERTEEHRYFLFEQLLPLIRAEQVEALIVAGDVFDTGSPSNAALDLYYSFLATLRDSPCRHVVVVGGNHDSPATLQAPQQALRHLGVTVVADVPDDAAEQLIILTDAAGQPALVVVAVPYLRERHLGLNTAGKTLDDIAAQIRHGIARHYSELAARAAPHRAAGLPVLATGHLFAAGLARTEGMRDIQVGNLGQISADCFSGTFDYVALGHIHKPQRVGGQNHIRYSGSPIPLAFDEVDDVRRVVLLTFGAAPGVPVIEEKPLVLKRRLLRESGTPAVIAQQLREFAAAADELPAWFAAEVSDWDGLTALAGTALIRAAELERAADLRVLRIGQPATARAATLTEAAAQGRHLRDLTETEVFEELLKQKNLAPEPADALRQTFRELLTWHHERASA